MALQLAAREELLRRIVLRLHALLRLGEDPSASPEKMQALADAAIEAMQPLLAADGCLLLQRRCGELFGNGRRIPPDVGALSVIDAISKCLHRGRIAGLACEPGVGSTALVALARALGAGPVDPDLELPHLGVLAEQEAPAGAPHPHVRDTHLHSVQVTSHLLPALDGGGLIDLGMQRRIVHRLVDALLAEPHGLAALTAHETQDPLQLAAAVRAAVHAAALAAELAVDTAGQMRIGLRVLLGPDEGRLPPGLLPIPIGFDDLLRVAAAAAQGSDPAALPGVPPLLQAAAGRAFSGARPGSS